MKLKCLFKHNESIQEKINKIYLVENYLDFFKIVNILRDAVAMKKIILTDDQINGMKFQTREINFLNEWKISQNDINNLINFKNRKYNYHKTSFYDNKILRLISKEISDLI